MCARAPRVVAFLVCLIFFVAAASAVDWHQWRGAGRDGVDHHSPRLVARLPEQGLTPLWKCEDILPAARNGGWSSPIVAAGKVYLFAHAKTKAAEGDLPPQKFPYLPPEKRTDMTPEQYEEYERNRRAEDLERSKSFRYTETVYCLESDTGKLLWKNEHPSVYTRFPQSGTPAVSDGKLLVLGAGLVARGLDANTGEELWKTRLPGEFLDEYLQSSFTVADGVAAVFAGRLFGLAADSGKLLWELADEPASGQHASPAVWQAEGKTWLIANVTRGETVCVDPRTGKEQWRELTEGGNATPLVVGDRLLTYGSSRKKGLRCFRLSPSGAKPLWTYQGLADPGSSPVAIGGRVFAQGERRLAAVDLESGEPVWTAELDLNQPRYTSLVAADGKVFYAFENVLAFAASAETFQPLYQGQIDRSGTLAEEQTFRKLLDLDRLEATAEGQKQAERLKREKFGDAGPLNCATPALAGGRLYLRTRTGLTCYDLREPLAK